MDSTLGLINTGYPYFLRKFRKQDSDILKTRLLLKKAIVMKGEEAAALFYDREKFKREGAVPKRLKKTLFGQGGVQGLDDEAHRQRKELLMSCMSEESMGKLQEYFIGHWERSLNEWQRSRTINFMTEVEKILCRAACEWTGIPLPEEDVEKRTEQLTLLIESAAAVGPRHYKGRNTRDELEEWLGYLVREIRSHRLQISEDSIIYAFSMHEDPNGEYLDDRIVAVELLNLIRPIVAIARYITFTALALYEHPEYRQKLKRDDGDLYHDFIQEVRRYYPFFPFVAAKVRRTFKWNDVKFPKGRRVLLDLYATNHDERIWTEPGKFYPERFEEWKDNAFNFIPQGGGDHHRNHRCAGEWITIKLTQTALVLLVEKMDYTVPRQNFKIDLSEMPARPKSGFKMKKVRRIS